MKEKMYFDANDRYMKYIEVFADDSNHLCYDEECTQYVYDTDALDILKHGILVSKNDEYINLCRFFMYDPSNDSLQAVNNDSYTVRNSHAEPSEEVYS